VREQGLPVHLAHAFLDEGAVAGHVVGAALEGGGEDGGKLGGLAAVEVAGRGVEVVAAGGFGSVDAGAPLDDVEVELEDALLAEDELGDGDEGGFGAFAEEGAAGAEEEILDELLVDGGAPAETVLGIVVVEVPFGSDLHGLPVEAVVLVEAGVFGGDDGVLEVGGDAVEGNEVVGGGVGLGGKPGLDAALDVDRGGGRVDETEGGESEDGEQPEGCEREEEPAGDGAEGGLAARRAERGRSSGGGIRRWRVGGRAGRGGDASG
jgi:hypothetical protein